MSNLYFDHLTFQILAHSTEIRLVSTLGILNKINPLNLPELTKKLFGVFMLLFQTQKPKLTEYSFGSNYWYITTVHTKGNESKK